MTNDELLKQARLDQNPTPEARFAMYHWCHYYAASGRGAMGFWDSLTENQRQFCISAIKEIAAAMKAHGRIKVDD